MRDYKVASGGGKRLNTASPFNIKTRSLSIDNFTLEDVAALYQQHTHESGQVFLSDAVAYVFELTKVNPGWSTPSPKLRWKRSSMTNRSQSPQGTLLRPKNC